VERSALLALLLAQPPLPEVPHDASAVEQSGTPVPPNGP
jgi:hypothetical protein